MFKGVMQKLAASIIMVCFLAVGSALAGQATLTSPANLSQLTSVPTFTWAKNGQLDGYIYFGSTLGGKQYGAVDTDNDSSVTMPGLPYDNTTTIYVRLFSRNLPDTWTSVDYSFRARDGVTTDLAKMVEPANNGDQASATFVWTPVSGATYYCITVGTSGVGSSNIGIRNTTSIQANLNEMAALAPNTPINVRLHTVIGKVSKFIDYTYNTNVARITFPATEFPTRVSAPAIFSWNSDGGSAYYLWIGSSLGGKQYLATNFGTNLTATVPGLPSDNSTLYVRLWSQHGTIWGFTDSTYKASGTYTTDLSTITNPAADNATLDNSTGDVKLTWSNKAYAAYYWLSVGSTPGGTNYFNSNVKKNVTQTLPVLDGLPSNTVIWVRLWTAVGQVSKYLDTYYRIP